MTEEDAEEMWGTIGQMGSATGREGALQLLPFLERGTVPQSRDCWPWSQPDLSAVLGTQTGASDMACACSVKNQLLSCVLAAASQKAEVRVRQEGCVSLSSWKGAALLCSSSNASAELVGPGWLIFKKMGCTVTHNKAASTSFTSHWKLGGQLINRLKVLFDCYHSVLVLHWLNKICGKTNQWLDLNIDDL